MPAIPPKLSENLREVRDQISRATQASGRDAGSVRLVAVTKQVGAAVAASLVELGVSDLGESRPQELWRKHELLQSAAVPAATGTFSEKQLSAPLHSGAVRWHLVGPLQRNKARRTLGLVDLIHSVDSLRLLELLDQLAAELNLEPTVLLEVNVSGELQKHGFRPDELPQVLDAAGRLRRVRVAGLMAMAPYDPDPEPARPTFAGLRHLRDRLRPVAPPNCPLMELSMGMSGDFEVAIAEGATIVRIGSALFRDLAAQL